MYNLPHPTGLVAHDRIRKAIQGHLHETPTARHCLVATLY